MNWLDLVILVPILVGLVKGVMHGFVMEVVAIITVVVAFVLCNVFAPSLSAWLVANFGGAKEIHDVIAYVLVFLASAFVLNLIGRLISRIIKAIHLGWLNNLLGSLFGGIKYGIVVLIVVFCVNKIDSVVHFLPQETKEESFLYLPFVKMGNNCWEKVV